MYHIRHSLSLSYISALLLGDTLLFVGDANYKIFYTEYVIEIHFNYST
jgi:hypothetical protein